MAPRRVFTVKEKAEIISKLKNGENNADLCKEYKVSHSTISSIWRNRDEILKCFESKSLTRKKNRMSTHQDVENALLVWYKAQSTQNVALSGPLLREKANHFARLFGKTDFSCSESWIYRFRKRYDIVVGKGREGSVLKNDCDILWETEPKLTEDNIDSQIWNADEPDPELNYDLNTSMTSTHDKQTSQDVTVKSCSFCRGNEDVHDITDKPYVKLDKTILIINDLRIEVNVNEDTLKTVCRNCDSKLIEIIEFVKLVKTAQERLKDAQDNDTQNEKQSASCMNDNYIEGDKYIETNNHQNGAEWLYDSDSESVSQTLVACKRKSELENLGIKKKRRNDILDPLSLNNDIHNFDGNEPKEMAQCKDEIADNEYLKEVISTNITIDVKEEIIENMNDGSQPIQPQSRGSVNKEPYQAHVINKNIDETEIIEDIETSNNIYSKVYQHEIEIEIDQNKLQSEYLTNVCADRINESVRKRKVANDRISSLVKESSDTVGTMPRSDLVLLVKSIVSEMLNK